MTCKYHFTTFFCQMKYKQMYLGKDDNITLRVTLQEMIEGQHLCDNRTSELTKIIIQLNSLASIPPGCHRFHVLFFFFSDNDAYIWNKRL